MMGIPRLATFAMEKMRIPISELFAVHDEFFFPNYASGCAVMNHWRVFSKKFLQPGVVQISSRSFSVVTRVRERRRGILFFTLSSPLDRLAS